MPNAPQHLRTVSSASSTWALVLVGMLAPLVGCAPMANPRGVRGSLEVSAAPGRTGAVQTTDGTKEAAWDTSTELRAGPLAFVPLPFAGDNAIAGRVRLLGGVSAGVTAGMLPLVSEATSSGRPSSMAIGPASNVEATYDYFGARGHLRGGASFYLGRGVALYGMVDWARTWVFFSGDIEVAIRDMSQSGRTLEAGLLLGGWVFSGKLGLAFHTLTTDGRIGITRWTGRGETTAERSVTRTADLTELTLGFVF